MEIAQTKKFDRSAYKTETNLPLAKGRESAHPFQWMLFSPQLHAIQPFAINKPTREDNTGRKEMK